MDRWSEMRFLAPAPYLIKLYREAIKTTVVTVAPSTKQVPITIAKEIELEQPEETFVSNEYRIFLDNIREE